MCYVLIRDIRLLSFRSREVFLFMLGAKLRQKNFVRRQNALQVYYIGVLGEVRGGTCPRAPLALPQLHPWNIVMMNLISYKPIRPIVMMHRPHQKTRRQKMQLQKMDLQPHFKRWLQPTFFVVNEMELAFIIFLSHQTSKTEKYIVCCPLKIHFIPLSFPSAGNIWIQVFLILLVKNIG